MSSKPTGSFIPRIKRRKPTLICVLNQVRGREHSVSPVVERHIVFLAQPLGFWTKHRDIVVLPEVVGKMSLAWRLRRLRVVQPGETGPFFKRDVLLKLLGHFLQELSREDHSV